MLCAIHKLGVISLSAVPFMAGRRRLGKFMDKSRVMNGTEQPYNYLRLTPYCLSHYGVQIAGSVLYRGESGVTSIIPRSLSMTGDRGSVLPRPNLESIVVELVGGGAVLGRWLS